MNIGLFTDTYFPQINGVGTSVHTLAGALEKLGHKVYIFAPSDPKGIETEKNVIPMPSMPCFFIKSFRVGIVYPPTALNKIAHLELDIVHTQTEFSLGMFGRRFAKYNHIPYIHTYHTMYVEYVHYLANGALISRSMAKEFSKVFCNSANVVIAPTKKVKDSLEEYGVTKPIEIIPTGIDTTLFQKEKFNPEDILQSKEEIGILPMQPVILSLGRIAKEKSLDVVILAMPKLLTLLPDAVLLIIGDGPMREELEALSKKLGLLDKNILFAGAKPWNEIGKYYQLGDVFVSASTSETQGLTFAEAMAGGLPVIAKRDESIENIVIHNQTGLLFDQDEDLPDILYQMLSNIELQKTLSDNAMQSMKDLSVEKFGRTMETLYQDIQKAPEAYQVNAQRTLFPVLMGKKAAGHIKRLPGKITRKIIRSKKRVGGLVTFSRYKISKFYNEKYGYDKLKKKGAGK